MPASPLGNAKQQFFDSNGNPLSGGKVFTFAAGTSTPLASYTDSTAGVSNANPVILDSAGRADIWLGPSLYKLTLQNSAGVQQWSTDNVPGNGIFNNNLSFVEASAPSGVAAQDILWADSSAHRLKMNNNNAGADTVVGAATTDTLTNKTFTGASSGNAVDLLNSQGKLAPITGTGADATVYSYTIPANTVGPGKGISVRIAVQHSTGSASLALKLFLGATLISSAYTGTDSGIVHIDVEVFNNAGVQNAQAAAGFVIDGGATPVATNFVSTTLTEDLTQSKVLTLKFNVANTDQITPWFWRVKLIQ